MSDASAKDRQELLTLSQELLDSIAEGDWAAYARLCTPDLTCFEPEARGQLVEGLGFHRFYFELPASPVKVSKTNTICSPHVRLLGDAAVVSYVRLTQRQSGNDAPATSMCEETRVWRKIDGQWKHVHFHRSQNT